MTEQEGSKKTSDARTGRNYISPQEDQHTETEAAWKPSRLVSLSLLAVLAVVGVAYLIEALSLPFGSLQRPGFGFFPVLAGLVLVSAAVITLLRQIITGGPGPDPGAPPEETTGFQWRLAVIMAALLVYVLVADVIGHIVSTTFVSAVALRMTGRRPWWQLLLFGIAIGVGSYLVFAVVLGMPLPTSIFSVNL